MMELYSFLNNQVTLHQQAELMLWFEKYVQKNNQKFMLFMLRAMLGAYIHEMPLCYSYEISLLLLTMCLSIPPD